MLKCAAFAVTLIAAASSPIQAKKIAAKPAPTLIESIKKLDTFLAQFTSADIQMAIVHAGSQTPADVIAASCWSTIRVLVPTHIPIDGKTAYAVQRLRLLEANKTKLNSDCAKVLPKFVATFNQNLKAAQQASP